MAHWVEKLTEREDTLQQRLIRESDGFVLHSQQDTQRILDDNARLKALGPNPKLQSGGIAARIPEILYYVEWPEEFKRIHGFHPRRPTPEFRKDAARMWRNFIVAKLHDRDFSKLRTDDRKFTADG